MAAAFPPAGEVVIFGDLLEAELLVVIGADEFDCVDRALLQRRIDVAARDLLRDHAEPRQHMTTHAGDAEFQALEIVDGLDLLAEPAAHLGAGIAAEDGVRLERLQRLVGEVGAAAEMPPGFLMAMVHAERRAGGIGQRRLLADVEIERGLRHVDRSGADRIERLQAGNELAGREGLDLEFVVGGLGNIFRKSLSGAVDSVQRLREARGQAPFDLGRALRDRRCGNQRRRAGNRAALEECTAFHDGLSLNYVSTYRLERDLRRPWPVAIAEFN
ncbi:hypothetical protein ACVWXM_008944 [Bradyrhizobium sp. GM7.3]